MKFQCVVCGDIIVKGTPHREDSTARDHMTVNHPGVKRTIPLRDLFREVKVDEG